MLWTGDEVINNNIKKNKEKKEKYNSFTDI